MPGMQPNTDTLLWHFVRRFISSLQGFADGVQAPTRSGNCGAAFIQRLTEKGHKLADEGSYFMTRTPTPGTGVITTLSLSSLDDAKPFIVIQNNNPSGGKNIHLDHIKLHMTVVGS